MTTIYEAKIIDDLKGEHGEVICSVAFTTKSEAEIFANGYIEYLEGNDKYDDDWGGRYYYGIKEKKLCTVSEIFAKFYLESYK